MEDSKKEELDEYEKKHLEELEKLEECKKSKGVDSCRKCSEFYPCELRKSYVDAVFFSMNKGQTGGFEF
ncbi:MAG: hypothetical protein OIF32_07090 [Campylobacterales bacterium]|nr:hypothetical protein [Campylobacterales bacterium]